MKIGGIIKGIGSFIPIVIGIFIFTECKKMLFKDPPVVKEISVLPTQLTESEAYEKTKDIVSKYSLKEILDKGYLNIDGISSVDTMNFVYGNSYLNSLMESSYRRSKYSYSDYIREDYIDKYTINASYKLHPLLKDKYGGKEAKAEYDYKYSATKSWSNPGFKTAFLGSEEIPYLVYNKELVSDKFNYLYLYMNVNSKYQHLDFPDIKDKVRFSMFRGNMGEYNVNIYLYDTYYNYALYNKNEPTKKGYIKYEESEEKDKVIYKNTYYVSEFDPTKNYFYKKTLKLDQFQKYEVEDMEGEYVNSRADQVYKIDLRKILYEAGEYLPKKSNLAFKIGIDITWTDEFIERLKAEKEKDIAYIKTKKSVIEAYLKNIYSTDRLKPLAGTDGEIGSYLDQMYRIKYGINIKDVSFVERSFYTYNGKVTKQDLLFPIGDGYNSPSYTFDPRRVNILN